ncbi:flavin monoamine oxidase family protein [Parafilimonas sp.]|uniref:flavin monoamine oxidase family protein n=1 Tax=Parafilimonas sp. TaxID=1969739 RepID=UPI0039E4ED50
MSITRRHFLTDISKAGLSYPAMMALGLLKQAPAHAFNLTGSGNGRHIIILGAGLAGMASAYELQKLGYKCTILEARERSGGRCFSVRRGSINQEVNMPQQTAMFDAGLYFNAGPSRIPHHHLLTLHYCKELGVPVQVYNNINEATYFYSEGKGPLSNKKIRVREIHNDIRGYMAELLAKAIDTKALDTGLTLEDAQKFVEYIKAEGGLSIDKLYKASDRRGFKTYPGAADAPPEFSVAYKLADIIGSGLMEPDFYNVAEYVLELQMVLMQAVGGNDAIAKALEAKVKPSVSFDAAVTSIKNTADGVTVAYTQNNQAKTISGDLCICTIPLPVLSNIDNNFSSDVSRAIDFIPYIQTGKIGLQFKRRFWEEDEQIYGGITHTNNELTQIFYPSNDYLSQKGILIGYYNFNDKAMRTGELSFKEREQLALQKGRLIHPQYDKEFEHSFSVSWHKTQYSLGGWALYTGETRKSFYKALLKPEKNVYFAGEHLTYLNAWMAGAFESARKTVADIHSRITEQRVSYQQVQ